MTDRHFGGLSADKEALASYTSGRLARAIRTSQIFFDSIASSNWVTGTSGFKIDVDGSAEFNAGVVIGADLKSSNWDGASDDLSGGAVAATEGYLLDYSAGAAQFEAIYAEGGALGTLDITGTLTMGTGALLNTGPASTRRIQFDNSKGYATFIDASDTEIGYVGSGPTGYGATELAVVNPSALGPIWLDANGEVGIIADGSGGTSVAIYGGGAGGAPVSIAKFYDYSTPATPVLALDVLANGIRAYQPFKAADGSAAAPSYSFSATGQADVGFYRAGTDQIGAAVGGAQVGTFHSSGFTSANRLAGALGSEGAPTLYFGSDTNSGLWESAADTWNLSLGGNEVWEWGTAVHISTEPLRFSTENDGLQSADGSFQLKVHNDGLAFENALTSLPSQASATPTQITSFAGTGTWYSTGTTTLWTHSGTNRDVWVSAIARFEWGETAAVAYTGQCRLGISFNGGSTWSYGASSIHYMGTGAGGCGYRGSGTVIYESQGAAAAVTGDIQMRLEYQVSNTAMDRLTNIHLMGRVEGIF